ncbi:flagellar hook protein FlgE [Enterovirga aerilata]|uniref:Flagellar hook protein FlgE n=1 Tax=Enterovirga aerilata TaxID=2730920 RepID=A0A849I708_9HYPH|nr:flagellar hook protein FlgE [Enterovirga sp. DB1703]NNM73071.1 flagellar hook protein FlgE [Enterovirga sp. DB1703]
MNVIGTASAGMAAAIRRLEADATDTAREDATEARKEDLAGKAVAAVAAKAEFQANAAVARTGSRTVGALVDILV